MRFNVILIGVGGEGVLTSSAIVAQAAHLEGYFVRGVQLHGLAQRGGSIPVEIRFGSETELSSPSIMEGDADLVLAFEPLEAVRAVRYGSKDKTSFVIDERPYMPIYANLLDLPYPSAEEIRKRIKPFAKLTLMVNATKMAMERFGISILGNTILLGVSVGAGLLPLKPTSLRSAIQEMVPRMTDENVEAFELGLLLGKRPHDSSTLATNIIKNGSKSLHAKD